MDGIEPAQLSFLGIYNPSLGKTEATEFEQIVYYYSSKASKAKRAGRQPGANAEAVQHEERNEQMRQIGLAQGMVGFAKAFSDDTAVDLVDTEKGRAWLHELEPGWWMVAHVDLTRIQTKALASKSAGSKAKSEPSVEYSSRELCPQGLLREQFLRAHGVFLLHHGASLSDIHLRRGRTKLCAVLEKFWNRTLRHWDVLMHGAPATDIFNGIKLAAGGELGIGVGEEEWGSGERAVLEDLVHNTDGLVDVLVARVGEQPKLEPKKAEEDPDTWLGSGKMPSASDGIIFSGIGSISREARKRVAAWMELIIKNGVNAYGVQDSPHSTRKPRRKRKEPVLDRQESSPDESQPTITGKPSSPAPLDRPIGIPPPLVSPDEARGDGQDEKGLFDTDTMVKYMTLGIYGSSWGIPHGRPSASPSDGKSPSRQASPKMVPSSKPQTLEEKAMLLSSQSRPDTIRGCFIIGMQGNLHYTEPNSDLDKATIDIGTATDDSNRASLNTWERRNPLRALYIERSTSFSLASSRNSSQNITSVIDRLRVVVYARQPFLYTFLFDPKLQPGLAFPRFYRSLHNQLAPLYQPLIRTTSPEDVRRRLWEAAAGSLRTESALASPTSPVYDLVHDPANGTCHTTLPNIPELGETVGGDGGAVWSRADAVAIHTLILRIWMDTRRRDSEFERTARTTRGWWVVWMRLPCADDDKRSAGKTKVSSEVTASAASSAPESDEAGQSKSSQGTTRSMGKGGFQVAKRQFREAFLVRRAPERTANTQRRSISSGLWSGGKKADDHADGAWGPGKLAEGIGIDTRKYIEGLLSLNR